MLATFKFIVKFLLTHFIFRNREQKRGDVYCVLLSLSDKVFCLSFLQRSYLGGGSLKVALKDKESLYLFDSRE